MKYAICLETLERGFEWLVVPWEKAGARKFARISEVPKDYILLSVWPSFRSPVKEWAESGGNFIEIDYGYWGLDSPRRNTRRVTYNGSHNLKIKSPPWSRKHLLNPTVQEWQHERGSYLLMIEPSPHTYEERTGKTFKSWHEEFLTMLKTHWQGEIRWRRKGSVRGRLESLTRDIKGSFAVVGENSMACAEAVMLGYPAYTTNNTIITPLMGNDFSKLSNPDLPDRTIWLEHVAWSQFGNEEFQNGTSVVEMVETYQIF